MKILMNHDSAFDVGKKYFCGQKRRRNGRGISKGKNREKSAGGTKEFEGRFCWFGDHKVKFQVH